MRERKPIDFDNTITVDRVNATVLFKLSPVVVLHKSTREQQQTDNLRYHFIIATVLLQ